MIRIRDMINANGTVSIAGSPVGAKIANFDFISQWTTPDYSNFQYAWEYKEKIQ